MMRHGLALRSSKRIFHNVTRRKNHVLGAPCCSMSHTTTPSFDFQSRRIHIQPLPMPAVAYSDEYDFDDDIGDYDYNVDMAVHQASHVDVLASAAGGSVGGSGGSMSGGVGGGSSRFVGSGGGGNNGVGSGGGGGGAGPYRCPKCGANVTFQDTTAVNDTTGKGLQSNCFYCAACSGWFLLQPNSAEDANSAHSKYLLNKMASAGEGVGDGGDKKHAGLPTSPSNRNISQPQFVMQHVSSVLYNTGKSSVNHVSTMLS